MDEVEQDTSGFTPLFGFAQVSGMLAVILTGVWMGHYRGGFGWADPKIQFNWHPLMMMLGMIYLYGNGILIYRVFRNERKKKLKITHALCMVFAFVFATIGLKAVFDSHNLAATPIPNLYSLHSWFGLVTVILFSMQWLAGFISFLFPGLASHLRTSYMPLHVFFGMLIFVMACVSALLGIMEKATFPWPTGSGSYSSKESESMIINWIGLLLSLFGILVIYLVSSARFKRLTMPEDEMLLQETMTE